jgi:hypothetical protein
MRRTPPRKRGRRPGGREHRAQGPGPLRGGQGGQGDARPWPERGWRRAGAGVAQAAGRTARQAARAARRRRARVRRRLADAEQPGVPAGLPRALSRPRGAVGPLSHRGRAGERPRQQRRRPRPRVELRARPAVGAEQRCRRRRVVLRGPRVVPAGRLRRGGRRAGQDQEEDPRGDRPDRNAAGPARLRRHESWRVCARRVRRRAGRSGPRAGRAAGDRPRRVHYRPGGDEAVDGGRRAGLPARAARAQGGGEGGQGRGQAGRARGQARRAAGPVRRA